MIYCNPTSLRSHAFLFYFLSITLCFPFGAALKFNLTNISPQNLNVNITVSPDTYISSQGIQLTSDERSEIREQKGGRAMYIDPLHLWDKDSRNLTDFDTYFSFVIDSEGYSNFGDGLTFFLIPLDNVTDITPGGAMGLPINPSTIIATSPFVAIEFDTYYNAEGWDPANITTHVGIDINSLRSNVTAKWYSDITSGVENEAWISYNSRSKNLSVAFTGFINNSTVLQSLSLIVDLRDYLPELVRIGFSASTGSSFERNTVKSWQFNSSLQINNKTGSSPDPNGFILEKKTEGNSIGLIVGLTVGLSILVVGSVSLGLFLWKRRNRKRQEGAFASECSMEEDFESGRGPKRFSYGELCRATSNFNEEQKLGEGGFGGVYRGLLKESDSFVAVKRVSKGSKQGLKEYAAEVKIISRLRHRNLVQLIGWCHENKDLLLVYEFMANSSLDNHLFKGKSLLTWETRFKIAKGLASALLYLHEEWEQCVVHRDVKSSNVMLDHNFNAKLGDFGLARLVDHDKDNQTTMLAGTMGYMAPECVVMGKASKESDVYSFGIVALEIACGRKPIDISVQESQVRLVEYVWNLYGQGNLLDAVDPKIGMDFNREEMKRLMIVGLWCAHPDRNARPSMRHAIHVLNFEASLPILPGTMPVATYFTLPEGSLSSILSDGSIISGSSQIRSSGYTSITDSSKVTTSSSSSSSTLLVGQIIILLRAYNIDRLTSCAVGISDFIWKNHEFKYCTQLERFNDSLGTFALPVALSTQSIVEAPVLLIEDINRLEAGPEDNKPVLYHDSKPYSDMLAKR